MQQPLGQGIAPAPPPGTPGAPGLAPSTPGRAALTFVLCAVYFVITLAVSGVVAQALSQRQPGFAHALTEPLLELVLLLGGLLFLARARVPELRPLSAVGLVRRPSAGREAALGAATGWAIAVALVLPGALALRMHSVIQLDGFHLAAAVVSTLGLLCFAGARQLLLCGLPFRSLSAATSPLFASVAFAGVAALLAAATTRAGTAEALVAALAQLIFCMAAARTRAIWLGTALQFVWGWTVTVLFGLPSVLWPPAGGPVQGTMAGPRWATGAGFGPEATMWAGMVLLVGLLAVWRLTRDYAWHYTFDPITGAGYPMDVPPPAEHTRMEQAVAAAPLVQIGGTAPVADPDSGRFPV